MATRFPDGVLNGLIPVLLILAAAPLPACGQETLQQFEARATELKMRGDAAGALAAWEQAAAVYPRSPRVQDEIGFLLAVLQRRTEAVVRFERALSLDSTYAPAHYHLGVAWWL